MELIIKIAALFILLAIAIEDAKTKMIHNILLYALILDGVMAITILGEPDPACGVLGAVCVSLPMALINVISKGGIGAGDILICIGAGLLLGPEGMLAAGTVAGILAGAFGTILLIMGKAGKGDTIPLGPFLAIGIIFAIVIY